MWPICKCLLVLPLFGTGATNLQIWYIGTYVDLSNILLSLQMTNIQKKARTGITHDRLQCMIKWARSGSRDLFSFA